MPDYLITLVHGTFARDTEWVIEGSKLRNYLKDKLDGEVEFKKFLWTGKNRHSAREKGAKELTKQIESQVNQYPNAKHFIIGHSHGGNVALYSLEDTELQKAVKGVICLNTPFINVTRRNTQHIIYPLIFIALFAGLAISAISLGTFMYHVIQEYIFGLKGSLQQKEDMSVLGLIYYFFHAIIICLVPTIIWLYRERIDIWAGKHRDKTLEVLRTPEISKTKVLSIWSCGDEVFGGFQFLETIANLPHVLLHITLILLSFAFFAIMRILLYWEGLNHDPIMASLVVINMSAYTMFYYVLFLILLAVAFNFILRLGPIGVSYKYTFSSFFLRFSFGMTPLTVRNQSFSDIPVPFSILNHLMPYENEDALKTMSYWIKKNS